MATYETAEPIVSPYLSLGDDVYAKTLNPWAPSPWDGDHVLGEPVVGQEVWLLDPDNLDTTKAYLVFANQEFRSFTANPSTDVITSAAHGLLEGTRVYFRGADLPAGLVVGQPYWIDDVTTDTFTLRDNVGLTGSAVNITDAGSGTIQFTSTAYRSSADQQIGTVAAKTVVAAGEGEAADAIVAAMKADATIAQALTDAGTAVTQTTKAAMRANIGARWTDEGGAQFDLTITDIP